MNNYPSHSFAPTYPYTLVRQYTPQSYYYPYNEYPSSPMLSRMSYTSTPHNQYSSSSHYYDNEDAYFSEHHHHHHHRQQQQSQYYNHPQNHHHYPRHPKQNKAHNNSSQSQQKTPLSFDDNSARLVSIQHERSEYDAKSNNMSENENCEHGVLKRDTKRAGNNLYKSFNATEFLAKTPADIRQEFRKLPNPPAKDPYAAKEEKNLDKNRYRDVIPGEATRVKLQPDGDEKHDFINANYVSGYNNQEKAYIFTQGPLPSTVKDFWRMVWQENISIVVMTTKIRETGTMKCFQYWPAESKGILNAGLYQIQNEKSDKSDSFVITTLTLKKKNHSDIRTIYHAHYLKWPDHGIPSNTKDALLFLEKVESYRQLAMSKGPVLLHCSAGIGRTGTFCAVDIGIKKYLEKKLIDIPSTVLKMRTERAGSVQTEDQYLFAHLAMIDFIKQQQEIEERINESSETDLINVSAQTRIKDDNGLSEIDDNIRKTSRSKINGKKFNDYSRTNNLQEPISHRAKTLSDSSASATQYLTPSDTFFQTEPDRHRSSTEHISSMPITTGNVHHKKARK